MAFGKDMPCAETDPAFQISTERIGFWPDRRFLGITGSVRRCAMHSPGFASLAAPFFWYMRAQLQVPICNGQFQYLRTVDGVTSRRQKGFFGQIQR
jgi:hypothetical protein